MVFSVEQTLGAADEVKAKHSGDGGSAPEKIGWLKFVVESWG